MPNDRDRSDSSEESRARTERELAGPGQDAWKSPRDEVARDQQAASSKAIEDSPVDMNPDRRLSEDEGRQPPEGMAQLPPDEEAAAEELPAGYDPESRREPGRQRQAPRAQDEKLGRGRP